MTGDFRLNPGHFGNSKTVNLTWSPPTQHQWGEMGVALLLPDRRVCVITTAQHTWEFWLPTVLHWYLPDRKAREAWLLFITYTVGVASLLPRISDNPESPLGLLWHNTGRRPGCKSRLPVTTDTMETGDSLSLGKNESQPHFAFSDNTLARWGYKSRLPLGLCLQGEVAIGPVYLPSPVWLE